MLSDNPEVIRQVTKDARCAVEMISDKIGISQEEAPDLCVSLGQEIQRTRLARQGQSQNRKRTVFDSTNDRTGKPKISRRRSSLHA